MITAAVAFASFSGCAETMRGIGASPAVGEAHVEQALDAIAARFGENDFAPKYKAARLKLAQSALVPSRIFDDTTVWDARPSPSVRYVYVAGTPTADGRYHLESRPSLTPLTHPGETRHSVMLEQLGSNAFRWDTHVDLAIGAMTAEEMSNLISALLRAPEGRTEAALRENYRTAFPRATAAFGKGFSVDSLHVAPGGQGATNVTVTIGFHPDLMKPAFPQLTGYLDKYLGPAKYRFAFAERGGGAQLMEVVGRDRSMTIRYRLQQGRLVSLAGPPRAWPDTVQLTADVSLKVKIFTVGFHNLVTDFVISNSGHDRGWTVVAQHEPNWDLPFITERLIRSPLRRPFEGQGSLFRLAVQDEPGAQSLFSRRARLEVQESAIMRFLGSLASHAVGDLDERVEVEEHRFLHDGLGAVQADIRALSGRGRLEE
jgi:hypothetical protein